MTTEAKFKIFNLLKNQIDKKLTELEINEDNITVVVSENGTQYFYNDYPRSKIPFLRVSYTIANKH